VFFYRDRLLMHWPLGMIVLWDALGSPIQWTTWSSLLFSGGTTWTLTTRFLFWDHLDPVLSFILFFLSLSVCFNYV